MIRISDIVKKRIGTPTDASGTTTLFAWFAKLFTSIGSNVDAASDTTSLWARLKQASTDRSNIWTDLATRLGGSGTPSGTTSVMAYLAKLDAKNVYPGTTLRMSSDAVNSANVSATTGSITVDLKRFRLGVTGMVKIVFDYKGAVGGNAKVYLSKSTRATANGKVIMNGLSVNNIIDATEGTSTSFASCTLYAEVIAGDELSLQGINVAGMSSDTITIQNTRIYYDFNPADTVLL